MPRAATATEVISVSASLHYSTGCLPEVFHNGVTTRVRGPTEFLGRNPRLNITLSYTHASYCGLERTDWLIFVSCDGGVLNELWFLVVFIRNGIPLYTHITETARVNSLRVFRFPFHRSVDYRDIHETNTAVFQAPS